ncbi:MAG: hypothetical protein RLY93_14210 [Sumerlaeia bacterium]
MTPPSGLVQVWLWPWATNPSLRGGVGYGKGDVTADGGSAAPLFF